MSLSSWLWCMFQIYETAGTYLYYVVIPAQLLKILPPVDKATFDQVRSKSVQPKDAMRAALKRQLNHKNPNVQFLASSVSTLCSPHTRVKNDGDHFLVEIASQEFMDNRVSIIKNPVLNSAVRNKILRLVQNWAIALEGKSYTGHWRVKVCNMDPLWFTSS